MVAPADRARVAGRPGVEHLSAVEQRDELIGLEKAAVGGRVPLAAGVGRGRDCR
jgi:hypothetical protein